MVLFKEVSAFRRCPLIKGSLHKLQSILCVHTYVRMHLCAQFKICTFFHICKRKDSSGESPLHVRMYYIEYKVSSAIATDTNKQSTYIRTYAYACMYVFWPPNKFVCMYAICICMYVFWPPNKFVCMYAIYIICMYVRMYFGHQTNLFVCIYAICICMYVCILATKQICLYVCNMHMHVCILATKQICLYICIKSGD